MALVEDASKRGLLRDWRDVSRLAQSSTPTTDVVDPEIVADFLVALTADREPMRVLDPWAGLGVTLAGLEAAGRIREGLAIEINKPTYELARRLWSTSKIEWRLGDSADVLGEDLASFDLIAGSPPVGLSPTTIQVGGPRRELRASKTYTIGLGHEPTLDRRSAMSSQERRRRTQTRRKSRRS
jgi:hypothetical protein